MLAAPVWEKLKFSLIQCPTSLEQCCNKIKAMLCGWYLVKTDWWWGPCYLHLIVFERTRSTQCTLSILNIPDLLKVFVLYWTHPIWLPTEMFAQNKSVPFARHIGLCNMPSKCLQLTRVQLNLLQAYINQCCQLSFFFICSVPHAACACICAYI